MYGKGCMKCGLRFNEWMVVQIRLNECVVLQVQWIIRKECMKQKLRTWMNEWIVIH